MAHSGGLAARLAIMVIMASAVLVLDTGVAAAQESQQDPWWDNTTCLTCHDDGSLTTTLSSGETISVWFDRGPWSGSIHEQNGVSCRNCHTDKTDYPHPGPLPVSVRALAEDLNASCEMCHRSFFSDRVDTVHTEQADVLCSDCHDPHASRAGHDYTAACVECHDDSPAIPEEGIHALPVIPEREHGPSTLAILGMAGAAVLAFILFIWVLVTVIRVLRPAR